MKPTRAFRFRLAALLMVMTLFLTIETGCSETPPAPTEEKGIDSIHITRTNHLYTPGEVTAEVTDPAQIESVLSLLKNVAYREQKNPYDTPEAKTILGTERITLYSGGEMVAEYQLRGGLYIRSAETDPWRILSNDSWQEMWKTLNGFAPFDLEERPYGLNLHEAPHEITEIRIIFPRSYGFPDSYGGAYILLEEADELEAMCDRMHSLQFREPEHESHAAPFYDGGSTIYIAFLSWGTVVEEYFVYGQFVSPTPGGPSSILTNECYQELREYLDSFYPYQ